MAVTAVIRDRGLQFSVHEGDVLQVNRLPGKVGSGVSLSEVLALDNGTDMQFGRPLIKNAKVECEIIDHTRGEKLISFKIKRRKNARRKTGHRQDLTLLRIKEIKAGS